MSAIVSRLPLLPSFCNPRMLLMQQVRHAGKGSPGQSQKKKRRDRDFRLKAYPGTKVVERQVLVTQRNLDYHPGLNALIDSRNNTIFAVCEGTFYVSTEKCSPDLKHELGKKYYADRTGQHIYKRFINVLPEKPSQVFRLIDLV